MPWMYLEVNRFFSLSLFLLLTLMLVHYIGGLVGLVLTGVFAQQNIIALGYPEGTSLESIPIGGWLDGHWMQVPYQLAAIVSVSVWSFVVTYIILVIINKIPSLALRLVDEDEIIGTDWAQMGERAYGYLPFEEDEEADCYRRRSHIDPDVRSIAAGSGNHIQKHRFRNKIMKLLMSDKHTVIQGVPNLVEEPVLDYSQQKELSGSTTTVHTTPSLVQNTRAKQDKEIEPVIIERYPMQTMETDPSTAVQTPEHSISSTSASQK